MQIKPVLAALRRHRLAQSDRAGNRAGLRCAVQCMFHDCQSHRSDAIEQRGRREATGRIELTGYDAANAADLDARVLGGLAQDSRVYSRSAWSTPYRSASMRHCRRHHRCRGQALRWRDRFLRRRPRQLQGTWPESGRRKRPASRGLPPIDNFMPGRCQVWVTRALADHLWPGVDPLGKDSGVGKSTFAWRRARAPGAARVAGWTRHDPMVGLCAGPARTATCRQLSVASEPADAASAA